MIEGAPNADRAEIERFSALASRWWDPAGEMGLLHRMNPVRLGFIRDRATLAGARCLDVGCGGGILSESMAREGATVTGIDLAEASITVARLHQLDSGLDGISYRLASVEQLAGEEAGPFDVVTCLEMLEHVPDPASTVAACARLVRPGGQVFFSTINRSRRAWITAIFGAEYLLALLPRGTHDFGRFIRPSELDSLARGAGLVLEDLAGLALDPLTRGFTLSADVGINYIAHFRRSGG